LSERLRIAGHETFRSFTSRNFRLFFGGQLISQAGTWMQSVAITWLVLDLTGSGVALGLVTAAEFLPILVFGAWAGVIADRVDRHRLMIGTQSAFLASAAASPSARCSCCRSFSGASTRSTTRRAGRWWSSSCPRPTSPTPWG
jgi:MFS family permease